MQILGRILDILKSLKVASHERCDEVKAMVLMLSAQTIDAYPLLIIKAEEVQLFTMQTAVNRNCLLATITNKARSKTRQPTFIMIHRAWWKTTRPLQRSCWSSLNVRLPISMRCDIQVLHLVVDIHALLIHICICWGSIPRYACPQAWWQMLKLLILLQLIEECLLLDHLWWQTEHSWVTCISAPSSASVVSAINWIQAHDLVMVWIVCSHLLLESGCV